MGGREETGERGEGGGEEKRRLQHVSRAGGAGWAAGAHFSGCVNETISMRIEFPLHQSHRHHYLRRPRLDEYAPKVPQS